MNNDKVADATIDMNAIYDTVSEFANTVFNYLTQTEEQKIALLFGILIGFVVKSILKRRCK